MLLECDVFLEVRSLLPVRFDTIGQFWWWFPAILFFSALVVTTRSARCRHLTDEKTAPRSILCSCLVLFFLTNKGGGDDDDPWAGAGGGVSITKKQAIALGFEGQIRSWNLLVSVTKGDQTNGTRHLAGVLILSEFNDAAAANATNATVRLLSLHSCDWHLHNFAHEKQI